MLYPTTETVIKNLLTEEQFNEAYSWGEDIINLARGWKKLKWDDDRKKNRREKWTSIGLVTIEMDKLINRGTDERIVMIRLEDSETTFNPFRMNNHRSTTDSSYYDPNERVITLEGNPSIITCWHELGHHLFGNDELTACIFSISLFKIVFPKAFEKLNWNGHMLTL